MVTPKTYIVQHDEADYHTQGEPVKKIEYVKAKDANDTINPIEVENSAQALIDTIEGLDDSITSQWDEAIEIAKTAIVADGYTFADKFSDKASSIYRCGHEICLLAVEIMSKAEEAHDKLQERYNEEAREIAESKGTIIGEE